MSARKMLMSLGVALLTLTGTGQSTAIHAHHSFAMFDKGKVKTLKGVVRKLEWTNPHVFLFVEVSEKEGAKLYAVECGAPNMLVRMGWKVNAVKVDDAITVTMYPLRDGRPGGAIDTITLKNGTVLKVV